MRGPYWTDAPPWPAHMWAANSVRFRLLPQLIRPCACLMAAMIQRLCVFACACQRRRRAFAPSARMGGPLAFPVRSAGLSGIARKRRCAGCNAVSGSREVFETAWGMALAAKLGVVAVVTMFAILNRVFFASAVIDGDTAALKLLRRSIRWRLHLRSSSSRPRRSGASRRRQRRWALQANAPFISIFTAGRRW